MPLSDLLKVYEEKTKPAFERFIEPTKKFANTIIPNYGFSTEKLNVEQMAIMGVDLIVTHVINLVREIEWHIKLKLIITFYLSITSDYLIN